MNDAPAIAVQSPDGTVLPRVATNPTEPATPNLKAVSPILETWKTPQLPKIEEGNIKDGGSFATFVATRLRNHSIHHPDYPDQPRRILKGRFWSPLLFDHLFGQDTVDRIVNELVRGGKLPFDKEKSTDEAKNHWTNKICGSSGHCFRRILAILVLIGQPGHIGVFIDAQLTDDALPLNGDEKVFDATGEWDDSKTDLFLTYQRSVKVQFFAAASSSVLHYELSGEDIKPWATLSDKPKTSSALHDSNFVPSKSAALSLKNVNKLSLGGGYGEVYQVIIHPWQHDFHERLRSVSSYLLCTHTHSNSRHLKRIARLMDSCSSSLLMTTFLP